METTKIFQTARSRKARGFRGKPVTNVEDQLLPKSHGLHMVYMFLATLYNKNRSPL